MSNMIFQELKDGYLDRMVYGNEYTYGGRSVPYWYVFRDFDWDDHLNYLDRHMYGIVDMGGS